ncbi:MAG TPA: cytochrome c maturation protein CcmE [Bryobacteraceae bacterium]|nr:cytochrome c maturation protein CcmE [Bryobacteraceae bacterium]
MKTYLKFGFLIVAILGTLVWLAMGGISETKTYYKTIAELNQMGDSAKERKVRVGGDIGADSIHRQGREVRFTLTQDKLVLPVIYSGIEPLPDTFKDGAQALADGKMGADGFFHATKIQAKCASKYEAKPIQQPGSGSRAAL